MTATLKGIAIRHETTRVEVLTGRCPPARTTAPVYSFTTLIPSRVRGGTEVENHGTLWDESLTTENSRSTGRQDRVDLIIKE